MGFNWECLASYINMFNTWDGMQSHLNTSDVMFMGHNFVVVWDGTFFSFPSFSSFSTLFHSIPSSSFPSHLPLHSFLFPSATEHFLLMIPSTSGQELVDILASCKPARQARSELPQNLASS